MKKYIRIAVLIYCLLFLGVIYWWNYHGGNSVQKTVMVWNARHYDIISQATNQSLSTLVFGTQRYNWQWKSADDTLLSGLKSQKFCNGSFIGYNGIFANLENVVIDPSKGKGRKGGENISEVLNQSENSEYYILENGYFTLKCQEEIEYSFVTKTHLKHWIGALNTISEEPKFQERKRQWTIAIKRYEYANLYHTMTDYYNAFLVSKAFRMDKGNITILWIDGHPSGALDSVWQVLFGNILRAGDIRQPLKFDKLVWGIMGYDSPLNKHSNTQVPYLEEFRSFFLSSYGINIHTQLNCDKINILFLWRRDYLAHPRNPAGKVFRKIKNENELEEQTKKLLPSDNVYGVQIDKLSMKKQLSFIARTDILVGMHGAGLTHTLFLPKHAGLVELYPIYWPTANVHFRAMSEWRNLHYLRWENKNHKNELDNYYTIVDADAVANLILTMKKKICK